MKKLLWFALFAVVAIACKDDDEKNVDVTGEWAMVSSTTTGCNDSDDNYSMEDEDGCSDGTCTKFTITKSTVTQIEMEGNDVLFEMESPYTIKGSTITVQGEKATAARSGNSLTITFKDSEDGCTTTMSFTLID